MDVCIMQKNYAFKSVLALKFTWNFPAWECRWNFVCAMLVKVIQAIHFKNFEFGSIWWDHRLAVSLFLIFPGYNLAKVFHNIRYIWIIPLLTPINSSICLEILLMAISWIVCVDSTNNERICRWEGSVKINGQMTGVSRQDVCSWKLFR